MVTLKRRSKGDVRLPARSAEAVKAIRIGEAKQPDHGQLDDDSQARSLEQIAPFAAPEAIPRAAHIQEGAAVNGGGYDGKLDLRHRDAIEAAAGEGVVAARCDLVEIVAPHAVATGAAQPEALVVGNLSGAGISVHDTDVLSQLQHEFPQQRLIPRHVDFIALDVDVAAQHGTGPARIEGGARSQGGMEGAVGGVAIQREPDGARG